MIYVLIPTTPDRKKRLRGAVASVKRSVCSEPIEIRIDVNNYEGAVKALLRLFHSVDGLALFLGDDCEVMPDTIQILHDAYVKRFPDQDGMCASADAKSLIISLAHPFAHTKTFIEHTHPGYFHNFVDREWFDRMQYRDRYLAVPKARILHNHWSKELSPIDNTYKVGEASSDADGLLYNQRRARNFDMKPR